MYKVFEGGTLEAARFFKKSSAVIYRHCSKPRDFFNYNGLSLRFESRLRERIVTKSESEDDIRKRLGLNPYGDWRNDEWIFAMIDRVNKQYPELQDPTYDPIANKKYRLTAEKKKVEGEWFSPEIDTRGYML